MRASPLDNLLTLLRLWRAGGPPPTLQGEAFPLARAHGLGGLIYHITPPMDERTAREALELWHTQLAAYLTRLRHLTEVWPPWAPPPMLIKGADLVDALYADPGVRHSVDLDLLLPDPAFEPVSAHLRERASALRHPTTSMTPSDRVHEIGFVFGAPGREIVIELHRDPQPRFRGRVRGTEVWMRGRPDVVDGLAVRRPSEADRAMLWLVDQINDGFRDRLRDWLDLSLLLSRASGALAEAALSRHMAAHDLAGPWALCLARLAQTDLHPTSIPEGPQWARWLAHALPHPCRANPYEEETPEWLRRGLKFGLSGGRAKVGYLRRLITARSGARR